MVAQTTQMNGKDHIVTGIKEVPVTLERPPAVYLEKHVKNPGVSRAHSAASKDKPEGSLLRAVCPDFGILYCVAPVV